MILSELVVAIFLLIAVFGVGGIIASPEALVMVLGSYFGGRCGRYVDESFLRVGATVFGLVLSAVNLPRRVRQG